MTLSGRAKLAGVIGWPVSHSLSPRLHGFWLDRYGIDGAYVPMAVAPENFALALKGLACLGFAGANLTVPHKEAGLAAVDEIDDIARRVGAVNTVVVQSDGRLFGTNTDVFGFSENLREAAPAWRASAGPAVVLGAGGAARAVCVALIDAGAPELRLVNRTAERAAVLAREIGGPIRVHAWKDRGPALAGANCLVNTTALGMSGKPGLDIDLSTLPRTALVHDIVYAPLTTPLLAAAQERGNPVATGIGMLLHQARPGFRAWFGVDPEVTADLRRHVLQGLSG